MEENKTIKNLERAEYDTELLEKILSLNEENNLLLKKIRRQQKWTNVFRVIYWILIVSTVFGLYYFLQPTINSILSQFGDVKDTIEKISHNAENLPDVSKFKSLLDKIGN